VLGDRTRGIGQKLKHWKSHVNIRISFSAVIVVKHCNGLPRDVVESPFLEILKI